MTEIPRDAFALVGETALSLSLLESFQRPERKTRAHDLVRDELMRLEAEASAPAGAQAVWRGELARKLIEHVESEVKSTRKISEEDIKAEYENRWLDYNRPRAVRTVQAFFPVVPPIEDEVQRKHAERLWKAVQGTFNLDQFGAKARPILDKMELVELYEMPPLAEDGRIVPLLPKDRAVSEISKHLSDAVAKLSHAGDISPVVGTEQGYHVFFVTEVVPAQVVPIQQVRSELERIVYATRVQERLDAISKQHNVPVEYRRTDISNLLTLVRQEQ